MHDIMSTCSCKRMPNICCQSFTQEAYARAIFSPRFAHAVTCLLVALPSLPHSVKAACQAQTITGLQVLKGTSNLAIVGPHMITDQPHSHLFLKGHHISVTLQLQPPLLKWWSTQKPNSIMQLCSRNQVCQPKTLCCVHAVLITRGIVPTRTSGAHIINYVCPENKLEHHC